MDGQQQTGTHIGGGRGTGEDALQNALQKDACLITKGLAYRTLRQEKKERGGGTGREKHVGLHTSHKSVAVGATPGSRTRDPSGSCICIYIASPLPTEFLIFVVFLVYGGRSQQRSAEREREREEKYSCQSSAHRTHANVMQITTLPLMPCPDCPVSGYTPWTPATREALVVMKDVLEARDGTNSIQEPCYIAGSIRKVTFITWDPQRITSHVGNRARSLFFKFRQCKGSAECSYPASPYRRRNQNKVEDNLESNKPDVSPCSPPSGIPRRTAESLDHTHALPCYY